MIDGDSMHRDWAERQWEILLELEVKSAEERFAAHNPERTTQ